MMSATNSPWIHRLLYDIKLHKIILFVLAIILYANTLGHEFVLDDGIVITENKFVKKGISGISPVFFFSCSLTNVHSPMISFS